MLLPSRLVNTCEANSFSLHGINMIHRVTGMNPVVYDVGRLDLHGALSKNYWEPSRGLMAC